MSETSAYIPTLTLEPNAATQAAVQEAPVEEEKTEEVVEEKPKKRGRPKKSEVKE